ncbi:E3 ubiquitin-protein ligase TRIM47-like isoform X2 [Nerophis lumbriciformis]|uniref:E3 ubiquitin-protein ligase TRIM47-like isoform X2 n=1 Tax=Nerophis lumbriciformis TaxID=546530 RepID=UPI002AE08794|nr:E3 ubiquitin-protein ligase TRIM47-like isoform X2 [Nerophis lumbriciformis]
MAHGGVVLDKDQFDCAVCLDVLKEPVTIPCGHSFCLDCISSCWDNDSNVKCPQCRQTFNPRPVLGRNILLDDMVGRFKQAVAGRTLAEEDDVECDLCPERKYKADKSCVECLASFCDLHIQPHCQSNEFKTHTLITASKRVQECVCGQHNRLLEIYCRTDKQCICPLCVIDQHKGHDVVMVEVERQEQQKLPSLKASSTSSPLPDTESSFSEDMYVFQKWMLKYYKEGFNDIHEEGEDLLPEPEVTQGIPPESRNCLIQ